ncbi:divalent-cation tolerance protein CutA [Candidatus Woesearchaeota archaeon]|nr:divalent-cation tolerance protein CutA [Candidatus Woesearchaeota archaeon]
MKPLLCYITAPNLRESDILGAALVKKKLASCVMTLPGMRSRYVWQGKVHQDKEVLLIVKTFDTKYKKLEAVVKKLHSYEVPCIIAVPIVAGSRQYLAWSKQVLR